MSVLTAYANLISLIPNRFAGPAYSLCNIGVGHSSKQPQFALLPRPVLRIGGGWNAEFESPVLNLK
jgi:hypothetical protein